jgi:hypothetical protein
MAEIQPGDGGEQGILGKRRLAQHGLGLGGVTQQAQALRQRDPKGPGVRSTRERRSQDLERPLRLSLRVVEARRTRHHFQVGRMRVETRDPGLARPLEVSALLLEGRRGGAVPGKHLPTDPVIDQPATGLREHLAGFLEPPEVEQCENARLESLDFVGIELEHAIRVGQCELGVLLPVRVRVGPHQQGRHVLGLALQDAPGNLDDLVEVTGVERQEGELQPGRNEPLGILHRLAERPRGEVRPLGECERPPVEDVHFRVIRARRQ